ncbi:LPS export ABC transporter periplasmic protein LptC [Synechococcus sp. PCC 7336]|uniref:LPS export ABC transporter periplasmic protein LptC n=1 Tax=Synechococcus sp. PCC 7336 TaxID=195250 RepID=UPI0003481D51|nr:LPS export ABC transporter periplasmic protein LptC [Synechococcus sp. PCC 7336]
MPDRYRPYSHCLRAIAIVLTIGLVACGSSISVDTAIEPDIQDADSSNDLVYENINLTETDDRGRVLWEVNAVTARYVDGGRAAQLFDVEGVFYDEEGNRILVDAETGLVVPGEQRLELEGTVEADAKHLDLELAADRAVWLPEEHTLTAVGNVIVTHAVLEAQLFGDRLQANLETDYLTLRNDSDEQLRAEAADPPLDILANELDWDLANQLVTASGAVDIYHRDRQIRMQGNVLTLETPTELLTLTGRVYALSEEDGMKLWSDRVDWVLGSDITTATGNVRYRQPEQDLEVVGAVGEANWKTNTVSVRGGSTLTQLTLPD